MTRIETFTHDGLTFDVRDGGPLDGEPVVLLHGFPERSDSWDDVRALLHAEGLRTFAPDQRGYSPRARPFGRWAYRLDRLVEDVVSLVDRIGSPVHLVGHDWGAVVAWALAVRRPEVVRSLTAVSVPHPGAMFWAVRHGPQAAKSWYVGLFFLPVLVESLVRVRPDAFDTALLKGGMRPEDVARVQAEIIDDGALPGALGWYRALPFAPRDVSRTPVTVPTTYVWSDRDVALSREAAEACGRFVEGDYRYVELEGVSHWVPRQAADLLAAEIVARVRSGG
ncbi:alpha/beta fold hydrolase [Nocardioides campestrisoli]|uniref:alpha/beta fold hydrolase n=1 Tax=Nocardioides campestrisoli TaxID=2736757 RepID=UPI0015E7C6D5|nr:alpha/beta fold hydrolase [Nocardioides campestrisoli]